MTRSYYPIIQSNEVPTKRGSLLSKNDPPQKRSKLNSKSKEQSEILEKEFFNSNNLNNKSLKELINVTGLKKLNYKIIFFRKRQKGSKQRKYAAC